MNDKWFRHYAAGREAFEHIDQRLPGEQHQARIAEISEGGAKRKVHYGLRMRDGLFAHSDETRDITESKFIEIERDVRELIKEYVRLCEASGGDLSRVDALNGRVAADGGVLHNGPPRLKPGRYTDRES